MRIQLALTVLVLAVIVSGCEAQEGAKRAITVADTIEVTRVAGDSHYLNDKSYPPLVYFSPDSKHFVMVLRKGNLKSNTNDYSLTLFNTADALHSPKPRTLTTLPTRSNLDGIRSVRWLSNETIAFIEDDGERPSQIWTFDLKRNRAKKLTNHPSAILDFRQEGPREILFLAADDFAAQKTNSEAPTVIQEPSMYDLFGSTDGSTGKPEIHAKKLFHLKLGTTEVERPGHELPPDPLIKRANAEGTREIDSPLLNVMLEEDANTPQRVYVVDPSTKQKAQLLDLNPQFNALRFSKVEVITWKGTDADGGGLYLPTDYVPGKRYPLVIQTHHFEKNIFMIDGPWDSGYAAQPLAAKGFVVLQVHHAAGFHEKAKSSDPSEAPGEMALYEEAIDYLDHRGLIDRDRVGILGFSRTVFHVGYALTHSKYRFAAAIMEEGVDFGYFQYLAFQGYEKEFEPSHGGTPWGLAQQRWMTQSSGFNLDRVHTPIRIVEPDPMGAMLQWEWFAGLKHLHKPVEMEILPPISGSVAIHLLKRPNEQQISKQGAVDWFSFWLKGEEDPDPAKAEQYARWRELRNMQKNNSVSVVSEGN